MMQLLFGFNGRIRRTTYWLASIGAGVVLGVIYWILIMIVGGVGLAATGGHVSANAAAAAGLGIVGLIITIAYVVVTLWIGLAIAIKRWHDRDKGAVWVLIALIPFVGAIWTLVECGFMDGTAGPNRFGPSPKGIAGPAAAAAA
jgi:uncharacterized membrane protein YhaH (DUF805 family)